MRVFFLLLCGLVLSYGQPVFEAASVKLAPANASPTAPRGGPGTTDPGTWNCSSISIAQLITMSYDLPVFRVRMPDWMRGVRVEIAAKVPAGATMESFRRMQQALLVERFHMAFHYEPKEMPEFELTVAKPGLIKEAQPAPAKQSAHTPGAVDRDGYPILGPDDQGPSATMAGLMRWQKRNASMEDIAKSLELLLGGPVHDATGLTRKYDVILSWYQELPIEIRRMSEAAGESLPPQAGGPTVQQALLNQLGLKAESRKGPVPIMVIDHADRIPVQN